MTTLKLDSKLQEQVQYPMGPNNMHTIFMGHGALKELLPMAEMYVQVPAHHFCIEKHTRQKNFKASGKPKRKNHPRHHRCCDMSPHSFRTDKEPDDSKDIIQDQYEHNTAICHHKKRTIYFKLRTQYSYTTGSMNAVIQGTMEDTSLDTQMLTYVMRI